MLIERINLRGLMIFILAYQIACKNPIGISPYKLAYWKTCHLPIEFEHKSMWAMKNVMMDWNEAVD